MLLIFNKIDVYSWAEKQEFDPMPSSSENVSLDELKRTWMAKANAPCVFISAKQKANIDEFRGILYDIASSIHKKRYPFNNFLYHI